jgi:cathepsin F
VKLGFSWFGICGAAYVTPDVREKYDEFTAKFGRRARSASEDDLRLSIFADNLQRLEEMQATERGTAVYSHLTPFADITPAEFSARMGIILSDAVVPVDDTLNVDVGLDSYDWREHGFTNHVKNQLSCGSCWTFSVVGNLEGAGFKATGKLVRLSEQQLLDCSSKGTGDGPNSGCNGGFTDGTMQWMIDNQVGLEYEEEYPYTAKGAQCSHKTQNAIVRIAGMVKIPQDEEQLATALVQYGPLSVLVAAGNWHYYEQGIYDQESCIHEGLNHGVTLVAFGNDASAPYWTIRNSWGWGFGENGHIRLARGKGMCGVQKRVVTATGITIDDSRPEPPQLPPGPHCCETKKYFQRSRLPQFLHKPWWLAVLARARTILWVLRW